MDDRTKALIRRAVIEGLNHGDEPRIAEAVVRGIEMYADLCNRAPTARVVTPPAIPDGDPVTHLRAVLEPAHRPCDFCGLTHDATGVAAELCDRLRDASVAPETVEVLRAVKVWAMEPAQTSRDARALHALLNRFLDWTDAGEPNLHWVSKR